MTSVLPLAALVGVLLGMAGGGGSVLLIPLLVVGARMEPRQAIVTSLLVVGASALAAAIPHARAGRVAWRTGALFAGGGAVGATLAGRVAHHVPESLLVALFSVTVVLTAISLYRCRTCDGEPLPGGGGSPRPASLLLAVGAAVGALTGLIGVGGGFLIVPALTLLARLPTANAIATSLVVMVVNAAAALLAHAPSAAPDLRLGGAIAVACILGSVAGGVWMGRVPQRLLRRGLAAVILVVGVAAAVAKALA